MAEYVRYRKPNPNAVLGYTAVTVDENNPLPVTLVDEDGLPVTGVGGGGGGAVDSVNGQTGVVVLDADDVGAVPATTTASRLYGTGTDGSQSQYVVGGGAATAWSIAQRGADGVLLVGTPTADNHAATKKYSDDKFLSKVTTNRVIYGTTTGGVQSAIPYTSGGALTANALFTTNANGRFAIQSPQSVDHPVRLTDMDSRVPVPPETGTYTLQSVDGVTSWVAVE